MTDHLDRIGGRTRPQTDKDREIVEKYGDQFIDLKDQQHGLASSDIDSDIAALRAERDGWRDKCSHASRVMQALQERAERAEAERDNWERLYASVCKEEKRLVQIVMDLEDEVKRARPVIEAALVQTNRAQHTSPPCVCTCPRCDELEDVVDSYLGASND